MFLCCRTKPFTHENLSRRERGRVFYYTVGRTDRGVALALGGYTVEDNVLYDHYDFYTRERSGVVGLLIKVSRLWHCLGYQGYPVIIQL